MRMENRPCPQRVGIHRLRQSKENTLRVSMVQPAATSTPPQLRPPAEMISEDRYKSLPLRRPLAAAAVTNDGSIVASALRKPEPMDRRSRRPRLYERWGCGINAMAGGGGGSRSRAPLCATNLLFRVQPGQLLTRAPAAGGRRPSGAMAAGLVALWHLPDSQGRHGLSARLDRHLAGPMSAPAGAPTRSEDVPSTRSASNATATSGSMSRPPFRSTMNLALCGWFKRRKRAAPGLSWGQRPQQAYYIATWSNCTGSVSNRGHQPNHLDSATAGTTSSTMIAR